MGLRGLERVHMMRSDSLGFAGSPMPPLARAASCRASYEFTTHQEATTHIITLVSIVAQNNVKPAQERSKKSMCQHVYLVTTSVEESLKQREWSHSTLLSVSKPTKTQKKMPDVITAQWART